MSQFQSLRGTDSVSKSLIEKSEYSQSQVGKSSNTSQIYMSAVGAQRGIKRAITPMQAAKSIEYIKQQMMANQTKAPPASDQKDGKTEKQSPGADPKKEKKDEVQGAQQQGSKDAFENKYFKIHSKRKNIEDILVYQALRDQKKMELMMKVRELRHVQIKEKYFDALIRLYDMNIAKYFHYNTETLPFTVLGIMLIFIGNIFINMSFTQNQVSIQLNVIP